VQDTHYDRRVNTATHPPHSAAACGSITDVAGIAVGHYSDSRRPTGCTVVLAPDGAVGGVDVRGAAPGTRETDLLHPSNLVEQVHAVLLAGGSAWGLDAASGVAAWLQEQGAGLVIGAGEHNRLPLVPAAVLFDLEIGQRGIHPDAHAGYGACQAASQATPAEGNVGAGSGASVGKIFGMAHAMKGGIGSAALRVRGVTVGALVACNALGDIYDPYNGHALVAGARSHDGRRLRNACQALQQGEIPASVLAGRNTTIGVVATDAQLSKVQAHRLAVCAHDGLARTIAPVHTPFDGDTLFALGTGRAGQTLDLLTLCALAAEATARATLRAIRAARTLSVNGLVLPCAADMPAFAA